MCIEFEMKILKLFTTVLIIISPAFARTALDTMYQLDSVGNFHSSKATIELALTGQISKQGSQIINDDPPKRINYGFRKAKKNEMYNGQDVFKFMKNCIVNTANQFRINGITKSRTISILTNIINSTQYTIPNSGYKIKYHQAYVIILIGKTMDLKIADLHNIKTNLFSFADIYNENKSLSRLFHNHINIPKKQLVLTSPSSSSIKNNAKSKTQPIKQYSKPPNNIKEIRGNTLSDKMVNLFKRDELIEIAIYSQNNFYRISKLDENGKINNKGEVYYQKKHCSGYAISTSGIKIENAKSIDELFKFGDIYSMDFNSSSHESTISENNLYKFLSIESKNHESVFYAPSKIKKIIVVWKKNEVENYMKSIGYL